MILHSVFLLINDDSQLADCIILSFVAVQFCPEVVQLRIILSFLYTSCGLILLGVDFIILNILD